MTGFIERTIERLHGYRVWVLVLVHAAVIVTANQAAFWLRFDGRVPLDQQPYDTSLLPVLIAVRLAVFFALRLHQGVWRYASIRDLQNIMVGIVVSSLLFWVITHGVLGISLYPRSVFVIDAMLLVCLMGGIRLARRIYGEFSRPRGGKRVLVYGAGDAGELIVRDIIRSNAADRPIGFIDDDQSKVGLRIHDVPVLGTHRDLPRIVHEFRPDEVLIAIPSAGPPAIRAIVRSLEPFKIPIKTLPNPRDPVDGKIEMAKTRHLSVEDLLYRAPVGLDVSPLEHLIAQRRVLVTGAGGSIGSELCRQIANLNPETLIMFDRYENSLHDIRMELDEATSKVRIHPVIGDVTDVSRVNDVMKTYSPEIIFHAAAHKHVPLMEENPCEAIKNNVRGTRVLATAAEAAGVDRFILISTDKAANPTSIMGASKRLAELVVQARAGGSRTSFAIVRFGNVLGSNGSVVPLFLDQIRKGGPVTVTHPEVRRFFMLIPEAVHLVLHAAAESESGATYVLDMGEQVKLLDMARNLIRLAGFVPDEEIAIKFIGLRPGEKLFEELVGLDETLGPSTVDKTFRVNSSAPQLSELAVEIIRLEELADGGSVEDTIAAIKALLPKFGAPVSAIPQPSESAPQPVTVVPGEGTAKLIGEQVCPACRSTSVYRSRARTLIERVRRGFTNEKLFRCDACGWRGWLLPWELPMTEPLEPDDSPDLDSLDDTLAAERAARRPHLSSRHRAEKHVS